MARACANRFPSTGGDIAREDQSARFMRNISRVTREFPLRSPLRNRADNVALVLACPIGLDLEPRAPPAYVHWVAAP